MIGDRHRWNVGRPAGAFRVVARVRERMLSVATAGATPNQTSFEATTGIHRLVSLEASRLDVSGIDLQSQGRTGERKAIGGAERVGHRSGCLFGLSLQPLPNRSDVSLDARARQVLAARECILQKDLCQPIRHEARVPALEPGPLRVAPIFQCVRERRDGGAVPRDKATLAAA